MRQYNYSLGLEDEGLGGGLIKRKSRVQKRPGSLCCISNGLRDYVPHRIKWIPSGLSEALVNKLIMLDLKTSKQIVGIRHCCFLAQLKTNPCHLEVALPAPQCAH